MLAGLHLVAVLILLKKQGGGGGLSGVMKNFGQWGYNQSEILKSGCGVSKNSPTHFLSSSSAGCIGPGMFQDEVPTILNKMLEFIGKWLPVCSFIVTVVRVRVSSPLITLS